MIELCFDQSTQGALRCAQHCGGGGRKAFGVIFGRAEADGSGEDVDRPPSSAMTTARSPRSGRSARSSGTSSGSRRTGAGGHPPGREPGGRAGPVPGPGHGGHPGAPGGEPSGAAAAVVRRGTATEKPRDAEDLAADAGAAERLRALGPGDAVRIWADQTPHSACGLLHAASLLKGTNAAVSVVTLPPWRARSDNAVETYLGWGEVAPELFGHFLSREEPLPPAGAGRPWRAGGGSSRRRTPPSGRSSTALSAAWGRTSTTLCIRRHIPEGRTKIAHIIGEVLGREKPGIGDTWFWRSGSAGCSPPGSCGWWRRTGSGFTAPPWSGLDISREIGKIEQTIWVRRRADRRRLPPHP